MAEISSVEEKSVRATCGLAFPALSKPGTAGAEITRDIPPSSLEWLLRRGLVYLSADEEAGAGREREARQC